jgi:hypothetical protein
MSLSWTYTSYAEVGRVGYQTTYYIQKRYYATSRKVARSIPDVVNGYFNCPTSSSSTVALGSTQSLTEMNTRNILGCRAAGA